MQPQIHGEAVQFSPLSLKHLCSLLPLVQQRICWSDAAREKEATATEQGKEVVAMEQEKGTKPLVMAGQEEEDACSG